MKNIRGNSHGGNLYLASKVYGVKEEDFLDYSANINPLGVPKKLKVLIKEKMNGLINYPNIDYALLTEQMSCYLSIDFNNVVVGNGATEIIYLALEALKPKKAVLPVPSFSEYKGACKKFNVDLQYLNLDEEKDFLLSLDDIKNILTEDIDMLFLCNPNNPTSTLLKKDVIEDIVKYSLEKEVNVILDESFIDLTEDEEKNSLMHMVEEYKNLIIVRSFTKFFGIPGLRIGCGICNSSLAEELIKLRLPWSINYFATLVGNILDKDSQYIKDTRQWINTERIWFYSKLSNIKELKVFYPNTNFILVKILDENFDSKSLRDAMGKQGILIRDCSNFNNLDNKYVRFAIKDREKNIKFLNVLKKVFNNNNDI